VGIALGLGTVPAGWAAASDPSPRALTWQATLDFGGDYDYGRAVAVQSDGAVVVGGNIFTAHAIGLGRYLKGGSLDPSFGAGGRVVIDLPTELEYLYGLAALPGGRTLVLGSAGSGLDLRLVLLRLDPSGQLDPSFGRSGVTVTNLADGVAVKVDAEGAILTAGTRGSTNTRFAVMRFGHNGRIDTTFGRGGVATVDVVPQGPEFGADLSLQPDGKVVISGAAQGEPALARLNAHGSVDTTFGTNGVAFLDLPGYAFTSTGYVEVLPDGQIFLAASANRLADGEEDWVAATYSEAGAQTGLVVTPVGDGYGTGVTSSAIQPDGDVAVAGWQADELASGYFHLTWFSPALQIVAEQVTSFGGFQFATPYAVDANDGVVAAAGEAGSDFFDTDFAIAAYQTA
jgi:uncharacterized delta-60 repeat protein